MYILFISLGSRCDIYIYIYIYFAQFNNNSYIKKLSNQWVQPDSCGLSWVGLV